MQKLPNELKVEVISVGLILTYELIFKNTNTRMTL